MCVLCWSMNEPYCLPDVNTYVYISLSLSLSVYIYIYIYMYIYLHVSNAVSACVSLFQWMLNECRTGVQYLYRCCSVLVCMVVQWTIVMSAMVVTHVRNSCSIQVYMMLNICWMLCRYAHCCIYIVVQSIVASVANVLVHIFGKRFYLLHVRFFNTRSTVCKNMFNMCSIDFNDVSKCVQAVFVVPHMFSSCCNTLNGCVSRRPMLLKLCSKSGELGCVWVFQLLVNIAIQGSSVVRYPFNCVLTRLPYCLNEYSIGLQCVFPCLLNIHSTTANIFQYVFCIVSMLWRR